MRAKKTWKEVKNIYGTYKKYIVTKNIIEVYEYEKLNVNGGGAREGDGEYRDQNYKQSKRKRRNAIRQLITTNFDSSSKFVTLTFDNEREHDITDVKASNKYFHSFIDRLRRRYPGFKYVAVIEFQDKNDRGSVHYHMICNLPYIPKSELQKIWGAGFVKVNKIDNVDNVGAYVIKYMTADVDDTRLMGLKAYNSSHGLEKPTELKTWAPEDEYIVHDMETHLKNVEPSYSAKYESSEAGHIEYRQYKLKS